MSRDAQLAAQLLSEMIYKPCKVSHRVIVSERELSIGSNLRLTL